MKDINDASTISRDIYVPIADGFFESSIMREEVVVRFVMLALIRFALRSGANGVVDMDPRMFAAIINVPEEDVERAVKRLMEPDPLSTSPNEDGRRLVPVNPDRPFRCWRLVNFERYRHIVRRANDAARKRQKRHSEKDTTDTSETVPERPSVSENVLPSLPAAINVGTKYEERNTKNEKERAPVKLAFDEWWRLYPKKVGRKAALRAWEKIPAEDRAMALSVVERVSEIWGRASSERRQFCPHPATWLSGGRWEDDLVEVERQASEKPSAHQPASSLRPGRDEENPDGHVKREWGAPEERAALEKLKQEMK